jgi:hypothetical protein
MGTDDGKIKKRMGGFHDMARYGWIFCIGGRSVVGFASQKKFQRLD